MARTIPLDTFLGILVGLSVFAGGGYVYYDQQQAVADAVEVEGTVLHSRVAQEGTSRDNDDDYYPVVEYRYTYGGEEYTNDDVFAGPTTGSTSRLDAQRIVADYSGGDRVTVHVDPDTPRDSYLIADTDPVFLLAVTGVGLAVAILSAAPYVRRSLDAG